MKPKKRKRKISKVGVRLWPVGLVHCERCGGRVEERVRGERASWTGRPNSIATRLYRCVDCGQTFTRLPLRAR